MTTIATTPSTTDAPDQAAHDPEMTQLEELVHRVRSVVPSGLEHMADAAIIEGTSVTLAIDRLALELVQRTQLVNTFSQVRSPVGGPRF